MELFALNLLLLDKLLIFGATEFTNDFLLLGRQVFKAFAKLIRQLRVRGVYATLNPANIDDMSNSIVFLFVR